MKRALLIVIVSAAALAMTGLAISTGMSALWNRAVHSPWPLGLGSLEEVPKRFPKREATPAALRLQELAGPLDQDRELLKDFVQAELGRGVLTVAAPSSEVSAYLAKHDTRLDAIREHLLGGAEIAWAVDLEKGLDAPAPNLLMHLTIVRALVARGLIRGEWRDLRAAQLLARSLESRPELISQIIANMASRQVNTAAWRLPLPAPAWVAELRTTDHRRLLVRAMQVEAWVFGEISRKERMPWRPYMRLAAVNAMLHQRRTAMDLAAVDTCSFDARTFAENHAVAAWNLPGNLYIANYGGAWTRVLRHEAEREATANALRIRAGQPIDPRSRCSDGGWRFEQGTLSFTADVPRAGDYQMPLTLVLSPR